MRTSMEWRVVYALARLFPVARCAHGSSSGTITHLSRDFVDGFLASKPGYFLDLWHFFCFYAV